MPLRTTLHSSKQDTPLRTTLHSKKQDMPLHTTLHSSKQDRHTLAHYIAFRKTRHPCALHCIQKSKTHPCTLHCIQVNKTHPCAPQCIQANKTYSHALHCIQMRNQNNYFIQEIKLCSNLKFYSDTLIFSLLLSFAKEATDLSWSRRSTISRGEITLKQQVSIFLEKVGKQFCQRDRKSHGANVYLCYLRLKSSIHAALIKVQLKKSGLSAH